jgi:hypothetical protein
MSDRLNQSLGKIKAKSKIHSIVAGLDMLCFRLGHAGLHRNFTILMSGVASEISKVLPALLVLLQPLVEAICTRL